MLLVDVVIIFFGKVSALGLAFWFLFTRVLADKTPAWILNHSLAFCFSAGFLTMSTYAFVIYPNFLSPLRHLPSRRAPTFQIIMESPRGKTPLSWIKELPDADMIRVTGSAASIVVPVSPAALREIMNTRTYDFEKPWGIRAFLARVIGFGLILSEGGAHKKQRKALTPAFNIKKIRDLYGVMWEKTAVLNEELAKDINHTRDAQGWGEVEMAEWGSRLTLDIIGATAIGNDFDSLRTEENAVAKAFLEILDPGTDRLIFLGLQQFFHPWFVRILPTPINSMLDRNEKFLRGLCHEIVVRNRKELDASEKIKDFDILSLIVQTGEFSDDEIVDQMLTFLAAGHETTASALTWCSYLLSKNPKIQTRLREEIRSYIPSANSSVTWDLLESMPYLNGVCEETLRLFPTVPTTIRETVRDTQVCGVAVPKDTIFLLVPYAVNRNPALWGPDADDMVPERWIDDQPDGSQRPNKHGGASTNFAEITFLHGPRACIGRDFAKAELRCAVAGVVGGFEMDLVNPDKEPHISGVVTTKPTGGMHLKMREVKGW